MMEGQTLPRTAKKTTPPARRRTRGEGTLYENVRKWKTRDGSTHSKKTWVAAISEGIVKKGGRARRARRFFYGQTARDAKAARDRYLSELGKNPPKEAAEASPTITECAKRFLEDLRNRKRAATTLHSYDHTLELHIIPRIGRLCLSEFSIQNAKQFYEALRKAKVSASAIARCHATLRTCLNFAVEEQIMQANPLASMRRTAPRYKTPRVDAPTAAQITAILKAAKGHRLEALFTLAATNGMRQGELFALRWRDVDLRGKFLSVERSAQEVAGDIQFVQPKTEASRRRIALSAMAVSALKRRLAIAKSESHNSELVFPSSAGCVQRKSNFQRREWDPIREAAGVPDAHFHSLRHGCATLLLKENVHAKVVQEMLGHSEIRTTLDRYTHVIPGMQATATKAIDRALRRAVSTR